MTARATSLKSNEPYDRTPLFGKRVQQPYYWRVVVCGSMSFFREMIEVQELLAASDVSCIIPDSDDHWPSKRTVQLELVLKRKASLAHIRKIRDPKTFGILVLNHDKYGVRDYIGANSFAEIAVAVVAGKRVYLAGGIPDAYRDELNAWGAIALNGNIEQLKYNYRLRCQQDALQLELF